MRLGRAAPMSHLLVRDGQAGCVAMGQSAWSIRGRQPDSLVRPDVELCGPDVERGAALEGEAQARRDRKWIDERDEHARGTAHGRSHQ